MNTGGRTGLSGETPGREMHCQPGMAAGEGDHYADRYWNDLPRVVSHLSRRASGDPDQWWMDYLKRRYATPPFSRALVIACGNGWVERELYDRRIASHFDAFDSEPAYLEEARRLAGGRAIDYYQAEFTDFRVQEEHYDLVINVAALHHARRLYETVQRIANSMTEDGLFVNWDYVGPSRNQYSNRHLALMTQVNLGLPMRFRSPYPLRFTIRNVVESDPTEAAHSSEIRRAVGQYFDIVEWKDLGGGIAYQILWNNISHYECDDPEAAAILERLLVLDEEYTRTGRVRSLFAFVVARRRSGRSGLRARYCRYVKEPVRETLSRVLMRDVYVHDILHRYGFL